MSHPKMSPLWGFPELDEGTEVSEGPGQQTEGTDRGMTPGGLGAPSEPPPGPSRGGHPSSCRGGQTALENDCLTLFAAEWRGSS